MGPAEVPGLPGRIVRQGSSVVFMSHDIDELLAIMDRVTVPRDGAIVGTMVTRAAGHEVEADLRARRDVAAG